jgi:alkylation response protein AidB-like acyl-CoA dehydrogenase
VDYRDSPEEAAFRAGLRRWLGSNVPAGWREATSRADADALHRLWHTSLYRAGYMGMSWPVEFGGRGLSPVYDAILNEEVGNADAPRLPIIGHVGRAIYLHGTEAQRSRFLPLLLSGEERWCQGFSEPEAGSDVASLRTRAERVGNVYIVNGQKMWTSLAMDSDWCLLLARTDPDAPKHRGISCLLVSMRTPGVTVRPIALATGNTETCLTFWDDVAVPADQMLGPPGGGWGIAITTLSQERGPSNQGFLAIYRRRLAEAEDMARRRGAEDDSEVRTRLAEAYVRGEVLRLVALEQLSAHLSGDAFGPEGSVAKLLWTEADQFVNHLKLDLAGAAALTGATPQHLADYLGSRQASVYGGTSQIQRNILARNVLGMPR